ncbi:hypothetical protein SLEP1_g4106 [Rubroshorea leprosula]|uniref:Aldehyde oxidase GLOX n=1 Tax=Rubroshorea leprosula TaxID=152421 RepID=A0AAV5HV82_9ROSI|nr:hypothetical protein SLEP1_g4106 [Rubroshorea leprosula]
MSPTFILFFLLLCFTSQPCRRRIFTSAAGGQWQLLQKSIGISGMHMQLLNNDKVIIFDRTDFGKSNLSLPDGKCRNDPHDTALTVDCTAHSVEYNVPVNTFRALTVQTDVWCSSGALMPDGRLVQTGGFNDGERRVRIFTPCESCDWVEIENGLAARRWYATNQILPDGRQIIVGGRREFNYEFYPKNTAPDLFKLPFLSETNERGVENNLYPFCHLNVDGNLFIFANNRAILLDYVNNRVVKMYPSIPGGDPRSYPSTGSSVLLPLKNIQGPALEAEVLICGGAPKGSYLLAVNGTFLPALNTCGRIKITDPNPQWVMEMMPQARVMDDMILLPDGTVLIINGAAAGTAGWENGRDPVLNPVIYRPDNPIGLRFEIQNPTTIPRMYHSSAVLLRDGRVLVGGSNPHIYYNFTGVLFPTELSLEAFSPDYLDFLFNNIRPTIIAPANLANLYYGQKLTIRFSCDAPVVQDRVVVTLVAPSFSTHSFSMNQRQLALGNNMVIVLGMNFYDVEVTMPPTAVLAPSGNYLMFVVHQNIPSQGIWIHLQP